MKLLSLHLAKAVWGLHVLLGDRTNKMQQFDYIVSLCVELKIWKLLREKMISAEGRIVSFAKQYFKYEFVNVSARNSN